MMSKVMVTGATGLLGRAVYAEFKKQNWMVLGLAFSRAKGDLVSVDLNDSKAVKDLIQKFKVKSFLTKIKIYDCYFV